MSFKKKYFIIKILKGGRKAELHPVCKWGLQEWGAFKGHCFGVNKALPSEDIEAVMSWSIWFPFYVSRFSVWFLGISAHSRDKDKKNPDCPPSISGGQ